MLNKIEILIDVLKEDSDELFHKERSKEQQIELIEVMINEVDDLKGQLEGKLKSLKNKI